MNTIPMEKHKTILLIRNAFSYDFGGGEKFPIILGTELKKLGYNPVIISSSDKLLRLASRNELKTYRGIWWKRQNWSGYRLLFIPIYIIWLVFLTIWYVTVISKFHAHVVHLQSKDDFIAGTLASKILRRKVIWTDHADLKDIWRNVGIWYKNPVGKIVYICSKMANTITVVSKNEKKLIEESIGKKLSRNFTVIYNGAIDTHKLYDNKRQNEDLKYIMTSRLVMDKGIGEAIEAFKLILVEYPNSSLHIYGDGPDLEIFKQMAKNIPQISFEGQIDSVYKALSESDIYIHPSYREGFSLSIVEAAMIGLPIIATRIGGNPEIVFDGVNGLLVLPKNTHELYMAMLELTRNSNLRNRMGKQSRAIYLNNFQFDKIVSEKFIPLYE